VYHQGLRRETLAPVGGALADPPEELQNMVKIRMMRMGAKKNPHYRMVVVDARVKRGGDYIESLGHHDPRETSDNPFVIDTERAAHWLAQGAQPTETALRLLEKAGLEVPMVEAKRAHGYGARKAAQASAQAVG
jgi:small subunit ribosomal protein S16